MSRIAIAGGPRCGKTTLARTMSRAHHVPIRSTDEVMGLGWSEASEAASKWFSEPGGFVIEGVAVARALRKWLKANPTGRPCETLVILDTPVVASSKEQTAMGKGVQTVFIGIRAELEKRGVDIIIGKAPPV